MEEGPGHEELSCKVTREGEDGPESRLWAQRVWGLHGQLMSRVQQVRSTGIYHKAPNRRTPPRGWKLLNKFLSPAFRVRPKLLDKRSLLRVRVFKPRRPKILGFHSKTRPPASKWCWGKWSELLCQGNQTTSWGKGLGGKQLNSLQREQETPLWFQTFSRRETTVESTVVKETHYLPLA